MTNWLISANGEKYDHDYYFDTFGYIDWQRYNFHYEVNDIVYIYSTIPQKIMYKTIVEGTDETFSEATDNFVRLRLLEKRQDSDFDEQPYIIKAPADESPINIDSIIKFMNSFSIMPEEIRNTVEQLSWKNQMRIVIESITKTT